MKMTSVVMVWLSVALIVGISFVHMEFARCFGADWLLFPLCFSMLSLVYFFWRTCRSDPGYAPHHDEEAAHGVQCNRCRRTRYERTHHCRVCDVCVECYDHHCPWVSNCIGRRNKKFYFSLLTWTVLTAVFSVWRLSEVTYYALWRSMLHTRLSDKQSFAFVLSGVISLAIGVGSLGLLALHSWLALRNLTTLECHDASLYVVRQKKTYP